jgi:hypothetical protein
MNTFLTCWYTVYLSGRVLSDGVRSRSSWVHTVINKIGRKIRVLTGRKIACMRSVVTTNVGY